MAHSQSIPSYLEFQNHIAKLVSQVKKKKKKVTTHLSQIGLGRSRLSSETSIPQKRRGVDHVAFFLDISRQRKQLRELLVGFLSE